MTLIIFLLHYTWKLPGSNRGLRSTCSQLEWGPPGLVLLLPRLRQRSVNFGNLRMLFWATKPQALTPARTSLVKARSLASKTYTPRHFFSSRLGFSLLDRDLAWFVQRFPWIATGWLLISYLTLFHLCSPVLNWCVSRWNALTQCGAPSSTNPKNIMRILLHKYNTDFINNYSCG